MSKNKLIVMGGDIFSVTPKDLEKFRLEGDALVEAQGFLSSLDDVAGQEETSTPCEGIYDSDRQQWGGKGYSG